MAEPKLIATITELPPGEIACAIRLRPVSEAGVGAVLASLDEVGHIASPLWVRKVKDGFDLLDGAHRLEAAKRAGFATVPVRVWRCNDAQARFMEIDGNLAGAELSALDTAIFLAERKRAYLEAHPETLRGLAGALAKHGSATELSSVAYSETQIKSSFAVATAEKFGISDRQVRKIVAAGEALTKVEVAFLRAAPKQVTLKDLQVISGLKDSAQRSSVLRHISEGKVKSASEAVQLYSAGQSEADAAVADPVDKAFKQLKEVWIRAPKAARSRFVKDQLTTLHKMVVLGGADD